MPFDPKPDPMQQFWSEIVPLCAVLWTFVAFFSAFIGLTHWIGGTENVKGFFGWVWQWNPDSMWSRVLDSRADWSSRLVYLFAAVITQISLAAIAWGVWVEYQKDEEKTYITHEQAEYNRQRYYTDYDYHHEEYRWFAFCVAGVTLWVWFAYTVGISPFPFLKG